MRGEARPTRARIRLEALRHNYRLLRSSAPGARVMAVIKADGYGHGIDRVARTLAGEADCFAVSGVDEAIPIRATGATQPVVLLGGFFAAAEIPLHVREGFQPVVHSWWQVEALAAAGHHDPLDIWIKVDSGMHRLGFLPGEVAEVHRRLTALPNLRQIGFLTHLAEADDRDSPRTLEQLRVFDQACAGLPGPRSAANSAGTLGWPAAHYDWVRPGISLYGASPFIDQGRPRPDLRPVMTLESGLISVKRLPAGAPIGYGSTWRCPEAMPVGVVAIGYGDGYPRHAPSGTPVRVDGVESQLLGRVSMDLITVDLRPCPEARPGAPVVLWGDGLPAETIAERAGTIAYELYCQVTPRAPRQVVAPTR
ncbi:alanine racemase [Alkalilimnicola ehrlichii]|uniref:alanine racemase n=1 Tax=Alkalilimnicola ehrlichii TaxID=351052 RepID=UPI003B9F0E7E